MCIAKKIRIGYFADGPWAHNAFCRIVSDPSLEILFVAVRYDVQDSILIQYAKEYNIPVIIEKNINDKLAIEQFATFETDLFVSMSFNQIFHKNILGLPPLRTINCHAGKLPFYRGRNILNWLLINDEKEFGITVHYVDEGIDTGDIILQRTYPVTDEDDYATLLNKAYVECADVLYDAIKQIQTGQIKPISQAEIDRVGLYCGIRGPGDEILDWNRTSREVFNFVRAICKPGPMATCFVENTPVFINKVREVPGAHTYINTPGQVIGKGEKGLYVKTRDTFVEVVEYTSERKLRIGDKLKPYKIGAKVRGRDFGSGGVIEYFNKTHRKECSLCA